MSAPSFSSFPPSFSSFPDLDLSERKGSAHEKKKGDRHKEAGQKSKKRKRDQYKDSVSYAKPQQKHEGESPLVLDDERLKAEEDRKRRDGQETVTDIGRSDSPLLFYSDRKGDPLNVRYGGLHSGDVPKHHLVGYGRKILGLNEPWTVVHRSAKGVEVGLGGKRKLPSLTDPNSRALLLAAPTRSYLASNAQYKYEEKDGFLRLPSRHGRPEDQAYRSITIDNNANSDSESSTSDNNSSDDDADFISLTTHQETLKSLEQDLKRDPSSVPTWLSLLSHTLSTIPIMSKNATKTRSEITLSLLSRALSADCRNATSVILRLKYLRAGEEVWHESKLRAEWEDALKVGAVDIWMEWLEWRIRLGSIGIDGIVEDGIRMLKALGMGEDDEIGKLRAFWRFAVLFQQAGFVERATALFQAQAELTFEVPQALYGLPLDTQLDSLEEFWESEVPRAGEVGAKGWEAWVRSGCPEHQPGPSSDAIEMTLEQNISDPYHRWSMQESHADRKLRLPTRSTDESHDTDPYATILFSDIRPLLLPLSSPRAKDAFRRVWLSTLGLHVPGFCFSLSMGPQENADDRWCYTHLTSPSYLSSIFPSDATQRRMVADAYAGVLIGREKEYASGFGPVKSWGYGSFGPLESVAEGKHGLWTKDDVEDVDEGFVRRVFAQLRLGPTDCEWDALALSFEAAINVKNALKVSRSFLSTARDSLPHWAAQARLERMRGRTDDARKVYQTILVSSPTSTQPGAGHLWWDWAEMEWLTSDSDVALQVVLRSVGVEGRGGVTILRAKRNLEDCIGDVLRHDQESWIKLKALLELLTSSPVAALSMFDEYLSREDSSKSGTVTHERLTTASLVMLYRYGTILRNPMPPSLLRERVERAVEAYPANTLILGMFLEGEKGQGVWGRVRALLGEGPVDRGGTCKNVARRVAEVWIAGWEKGRWMGEIERTRSGLLNALQNERTSGSAVLWRIYIEFEVRADQLERAKKMLFRAIGECPLSKELYLMAFGPLRSAFTSQELHTFSDTMAERQLRMRKGVDELLERWEDPKGGYEDSEDGVSGYGMDEIEHNANELRRLRPY